MVSKINYDTMIEKLAIDNALILKEEKVLTDTKLRNLKPQGKMYKVPDRDIAGLIAPYVGDDMQAWPVNRRVSKAKYDDADLIQPMEAAR
jgi:hypothetical protein